MSRWRGDRGSAAAELVTATVPVAVLLLVFMVLVGRGVTARLDLDAAAAAAARAASLERTVEAAQVAATSCSPASCSAYQPCSSTASAGHCPRSAGPGTNSWPRC